MSVKITDRKQALDLIVDKYDYFLFDCDGVIWLGDHLLPSVSETLEYLRSKNKTIIFVTNNSTKSREDYLKKFEKMGIKNVNKSELFGSAYATAIYIDKILKLPKDKHVWVLGEEGIETELKEVGYKTLGGTDAKLEEDGINFNPNNPILDNLDSQVGAVVCGLTFKINYLKLSMTMQYLLKDNKTLPFIATNIDSTFPMKGKLLIGAGSVIESVAYASGRQPDAICGKPNQSMMDAVKAQLPGLKENPKRGLMVGDRLNTDMKFGRDGGLDTLLVLTGIETEENVKSLKAGEAPTYYADKLGDLYEFTH
ncbi:4-nitrophenylphosphatase [Lodderomyces elongisporus]|uniref:4-nitrophenylphosphatase n=1 Tax=Lodderomyces elongisporus TaxID=36914 RepID=UPI00291D8779|nr:4-nitrophenylphosphatase [Lodderomyces elongisporus]WLF76850.1 4-nitrophenylphosphatase [Lodderomyces elongisporus]